MLVLNTETPWTESFEDMWAEYPGSVIANQSD